MTTVRECLKTTLSTTLLALGALHSYSQLLMMPVDNSSQITWEVERLRLTGFPVLAPPLEGTTWWNDLVGDDPETRVAHPKKGELLEQGEYEGNQLTLKVTRSRIDWFLSTKEVLTNLPTIGVFDEKCDEFVTLVSRWLELDTGPSLTRLAFGAVLLHPAKNRVEGYTKIQPYLHRVTLEPEESSDFLYQINRPREAEVAISGLQINRLSKWSVGRIKLFTVDAAGIQNPVEQYVCRLELDINTAPDLNGELPRSDLVSVYNELVVLGREIAEQGDIP